MCGQQSLKNCVSQRRWRMRPETLARYQNHTYFLQALAVRISLELETPRIVDFRQRVLGILRTR
jgi:hypothetical protein